MRKRILSVLSLGWRNSEREWRHFARAYLFLAAFSTPLVLSVHSVVSFDFAMGIVPGWHTTIFPPYFVAGAIFSGFGMVWTIIIPMRRWFNMKHYVTLNHLDAAANQLRYEQQLAARAGDPPTTRLDADWRQRMEDVLWAVLNSPELVFNR